MTSYQGNHTVISSEVASQSAFSEVNSQDLASFSSPRGLSEDYSLEDVFAAMVKEMGDLSEKVSALEIEFNHFKERSPRTSRSCRGLLFNSGENDEYRDILIKKGNLLERITATIQKMDLSPEIPKAKVHCYQKYAALLKKRYENIQQDVNMLMEDVKESKEECVRMEQQVETFRMLKKEEHSNKGDELTRLFKEAKTDLNLVLSAFYPVSIQEEFSEAMAQLTEVFMKNDNVEEQYVELSPETLQNSGIVCLIKDNAIVEDPCNPARYRLNMAE